MGLVELDAALGDAERVLLDSSTLIAFHTPLEQVHPLAKRLLERIERSSDPLRGYYSVVSAAELLVRPIRAGTDRFTFMHTFLTAFPNLTPLPMDLPVAVQAATLRATTGLPLPDAIIIASGLLAGCEAIVSNDERWQRRFAPLFRNFRWIHLGDYLA
ncbi:MAG: type II toxin-antitoxin system VapC family toxin [Chloroflexi bacterium]|nr:type II toxin-antitoxin system VapC family toxin [Chloroflexota bacterium]